MSECHVSEYYIDKEALITQLEQNRANAIECLWRYSATNSYLREQIPNKVSLLELAIDELKSGNKEPKEVTSYFEELVQEELRALNSSLKAVNKKGLPKQSSKVIKPKIRVV